MLHFLKLLSINEEELFFFFFGLRTKLGSNLRLTFLSFAKIHLHMYETRKQILEFGSRGR